MNIPKGWEKDCKLGEGSLCLTPQKSGENSGSERPGTLTRLITDQEPLRERGRDLVPHLRSGNLEIIGSNPIPAMVREPTSYAPAEPSKEVLAG